MTAYDSYDYKKIFWVNLISQKVELDGLKTSGKEKKYD